MRTRFRFAAGERINRLFFWNAIDLQRKLNAFRVYYNAHRTHRSLGGMTPRQKAGEPCPAIATLDRYEWQTHCRGLFHTPVAV